MTEFHKLLDHFVYWQYVEVAEATAKLASALLGGMEVKTADALANAKIVRDEIDHYITLLETDVEMVEEGNEALIVMVPNE